MLAWAATFLLVALLAGAMGFGGVAGAATEIAQGLCIVFLAAFVVLLLVGRRRRAPPRRDRRRATSATDPTTPTTRL